MTAERKEIVVPAHRGHFEQFGPDLRKQTFILVSVRFDHDLFGGRTPALHGEKCAPIYFAVRGERESGYKGKAVGNHMRG
ncbi:MAG: hypothetical protein AAFY88_06580, partial [Acidobacteriota bacterium]